MTRCRCGNVLEAEDGRGYTYVPPSCLCGKPGKGAPKRIVPRHLSKRQREQRERYGLPLMTDPERAAMASPKWQ